MPARRPSWGVTAGSSIDRVCAMRSIARPASGNRFRRSSAAIRSFRDQLQARGIRLLVVPVPNKESVYPGMLAERAEDAGVVVGEQTRRLLDQLEQYGIEHVDLFEVFRRARQEESRSDPRRLYLAQDTHWSPEGARVAAGAYRAASARWRHRQAG